MQLTKLQSNDEQWKQFLKNNEHLIFHRPEYKEFIEETFPNTKANYYAIKNKLYRTNQIQMLFPIHHIGQPILRKIFFSPFFDIFKPKLISAAFHDFGGPIGEIKTGYLLPLFKQLKEKYQNINHIIIKNNHETFNKFIKEQDYSKFIIKLSDKETVWKKIQKYKRKAIKKSQREGIITREIQEHEINNLYKLYLKNMRDFGELPYQKKYFKNFYKHFINKGLGKCFGAYYNDKLVAILLGYCCSKKIHVIIAVSDKKYLNFRTNDAVHWSFIEWACDNGYQEFDFGRTRTESGQYHYKKKWGGEEIKLITNYLPLKNKPIPKIDPTNPKYKLFIKIEQNLPLWFTKYVSSWFREGLGI